MQISEQFRALGAGMRLKVSVRRARAGNGIKRLRRSGGCCAHVWVGIRLKVDAWTHESPGTGLVVGVLRSVGDGT